MTFEEIQENITVLAGYLQESDYTTPTDRCNKLQTLIGITATLTELIPTLKLYVANKKEEFFENIPEGFNKLSARMQSERYFVYCKNETYVYDCAVSIYKTASLQMDALRTLISSDKEEKKQSMYVAT